MVAFEPLTGARVPDQSDGPLGGLQIANAVTDLAPVTLPRFPTVTDRDAAYAAFVAAGGVLEDGMHCAVGQDRYRRRNGAWKLDSINAGTSGVVAGTAPAAGTPLLVKTWAGNVTFNASGDNTVTFPGGAFPNGVVAAKATALTSSPWSINPWGVTLAQANLRLHSAGAAVPSQIVTTCVTAIGW